MARFASLGRRMQARWSNLLHQLDTDRLQHIAATPHVKKRRIVVLGLCESPAQIRDGVPQQYLFWSARGNIFACTGTLFFLTLLQEAQAPFCSKVSVAAHYSPWLRKQAARKAPALPCQLLQMPKQSWRCR